MRTGELQPRSRLPGSFNVTRYLCEVVQKTRLPGSHGTESSKKIHVLNFIRVSKSDTTDLQTRPARAEGGHRRENAGLRVKTWRNSEKGRRGPKEVETAPVQAWGGTRASSVPRGRTAERFHFTAAFLPPEGPSAQHKNLHFRGRVAFFRRYLGCGEVPRGTQGCGVR